MSNDEFLPRPAPRESSSRFGPPRLVRLVLLIVGGILVGGVVIELTTSVVDAHSAEVIGVVDAVNPDASKYERMTYHYEVDGRTYHGSGNSTDESMVGRKVRLRYDPEDPGTSWLAKPEEEPPSARGPSGLTVLLVGVVLAVLIWFMVRPPWRRRYRRTAR